MAITKEEAALLAKISLKVAALTNSDPIPLADQISKLMFINRAEAARAVADAIKIMQETQNEHIFVINDIAVAILEDRAAACEWLEQHVCHNNLQIPTEQQDSPVKTDDRPYYRKFEKRRPLK